MQSVSDNQRTRSTTATIAYGLCAFLLVSIMWIWVDDTRARLTMAEEALQIANGRVATLQSRLDRCRADTNRVIQVGW